MKSDVVVVSVKLVNVSRNTEECLACRKCLKNTFHITQMEQLKELQLAEEDVKAKVCC